MIPLLVLTDKDKTSLRNVTSFPTNTVAELDASIEVGRPTRVGMTTDGISSCENPALQYPLPTSMTTVSPALLFWMEVTSGL